MKIIKTMKTTIHDLYQSINITKEEWKRQIQAYIGYRVFKKEYVDKARIKADEEYTKKELIDSLLVGVDEKDISLYKSILQNQYNYCVFQRDHNTDDNYENVMKLMLPMVRRILPYLTISKLIGVQPMQGPVGLTYKLRYTYRDDETNESEEIDEDITADHFIPTKGKRMTLEVISQVIEARSRKLTTAWTIEAMQDINSYHGLNIEAELMQAMAQEIATEINFEWLAVLQDVAKKQTYKVKNDDELLVIINHACSNIAFETRRGAGNWVVMNPIMLARFQNAVAGKHVYKTEKEKPTGFDLSLAGTYNEAIKMYQSMNIPENEILVGYKGGNGECDTGMIYSPYHMLMSAGVVVNSKTFQPLIRFMTRYGVGTDEKTPDYYRNITIE